MKKINCIVIIDDDPIAVFIARGVCDNCCIAHEAVSFSNGLDALQFISTYANLHSACPELIIVDINMPDSNGFEFGQKVGAMPLGNMDKVVLIAMSASVKKSWREKHSNYKEFVYKPFTIEKANQIFENYFVNKQA